MISSALTHGERAKTFQQKKVTDLIDMMYKQQLIKSSQASIGTSQQNAETGSMNAATSRLNAIRQLKDDARRAPLGINMDMKEYSSLDNKTKEYLAYAFFSSQDEDGKLSSFNEWNREVGAGTKYDQYKMAENDPKFAKFLETQRPSTVINVGQRAEESGLGKARADVQSPDFVNKSIEGLRKRNPQEWNDPNPTVVKEVMDTMKVDEDSAISIVQKQMVLKDLEMQILAAFPNAVFKIRKDDNGPSGWYVGDRLIMRNPYGS